MVDSSKDTIFISIVSYCDKMLLHTILSAVSTAANNKRLVFGVVEQAYPEGRIDAIGFGSAVRYVRLDPIDARGPCWARAIAMSLYQDETWFLQIDSHMVFDQDWDEKMIAAMHQCPSERPIISHYPIPFKIDFETGKVTKESRKCGLKQMIKENTTFKDDGLVLTAIAVDFDSETPIPGSLLAGGFLFAPGKIVNELPYDPKFYFHGEEQSYALRAFTRGWDIFHAPRIPIYHLYDTDPDNCYRPKHWTKEDDEKRKVRWWEFQKFAAQRFKDLVHGKDLGVYGLGNVRTVEEYAEYSGIDYLNKTLHPKIVHRSGEKEAKNEN